MRNKQKNRKSVRGNIDRGEGVLVVFLQISVVFWGFFDVQRGFLRYFFGSEGFFDLKQLDQAQKRQFWLVLRCYLSKVLENASN